MSSAEIRRVEEILTSEYSTEKYVELLKEIFDDIQLVAPDKHRKEYSNYSSHIEGYCHIGFYNAPENKKVILYAVRLKSLGYVEHSRSTQRSYVKALIENSGSDAAIVAFYSERDAKWRLSFVRLDYEAQMQNGKVKLAQNMTPAKRYSFLVGKDEPCHTAVERFRSFLEGNTANPSLDDLEEAFSVEAVTKEFFNLYCEKFKQLLIHLEDSEEFMAEATAHNFTAAQFAKKLMGQIVFLYFLQKKGWLGVNAWPKRISEKEYKDAYYRFGKKTKELIPVVYLPAGDGTYVISGAGLNRISDEDEAVLARSVKGEPWGTGPRNFMRKLFETAAKKNLNFFDNYLEPLFYNALNRNRGEQGYDPNLHCRIPFLSGGLFEPLAGYDWEHSEFSIPNEVFSNRQNNNSRTGDGILDVFDRYNFTMSEDEPLEREVAIDPEMLGKVFENLLEVRDRKAKGAFYTPREIVHYMCQESLIAYLKESLQTDEASVRDFILYGDFMKDSDTVNKRNIQQSNLMISEQLFKVDGNGKVVVNRLMEMDEALREIRVADPAVGSGAFPLGMLNEIVRARQNISAYMAIGKNPNQIRMMYALERAPYALKRDTIRNCIFAADIDPSAVDIARLRLWLSLVIDDEINPTATDELDGHRNPLPLPNLECNIICGNSLIDEFEGIKLINQSELIGTAAEGQTNLGIGVFEPILKKLIATQEELFKCDNTDTKKQLLEQIDSLKDRIIRSQLEGAAPEIIEHYEDSKMAPSKPYLLWQLEFAKVFKEKGGFDVVIGNPPYLESRNSAFSEELKDALQLKVEKKYGNKSGWFPRGADLLIYFFELSFNIMSERGLNTYITQNSWLDTEFGKKFQDFLLNTTDVLAVVDSDYKYFETADINTVITFFKGRTGMKEPVMFARCHKSLMSYSLPIGGTIVIDEEAVTYKIFKPDEAVLKDMKWGTIFNIDVRLLSMINKANTIGKKVGELDYVSIGQGLNLTKNAVLDENKAEMLGLSTDLLVPFFTKEESMYYGWNKSSHFLIRKSMLKDEEINEIRKLVEIFDDTKTTKKPPILILPRGIGAKHFCCVNNVHGYSASCVDVYVDNPDEHKEDVIRMWAYMNSSLFWLIREIAGRKNLGGGMLKAEAVDIKAFAVLLPLGNVDKLKELYDIAGEQKIQNVSEAILEGLHNQIDEIVYDCLGIGKKEQMYIRNLLMETVNSRYMKTRNA